MRAALGWLLLLTMVAGALAPAVPVVGAHAPRLVWVPLDSRPVNTDEVALFADAAGMPLALPPAGALDWYASRRSDFPRLIAWLRETTQAGDTQVLYMNSLLAGGLIASRDVTLYEELPERLRILEAALRATPPGRRVAVHVLPRALVTQFRADGSANPDYAWRDQLLERTELRYRLARGLPADRQRLSQLERQISEPVRLRADALLQRNAALLDALFGWVNEGLLDQVIIGLDDAQPYSETRLLHEEAGERAADLVASGRVHLHYGADEIGFLVVAHEAALRAGVAPSFHLDYDQPAAAGRVLPYEGAPLADSVDQKVKLLGGRLDAHARQHVVLHTAPWSAAPALAGAQVARVAEALDGGGEVTVADVTGTGARDGEYIRALTARVPPGSFAYASWNTASNSVGTALAMATVSEVHRARGATADMVRARLMFQAVRYTYDMVYQSQKEQLQAWAAARGISPTGLGASQPQMQARLAATAVPAAQEVLDAALRGRDVAVGDGYYQVCSVRVGLTFPWGRLFEVAAQPEVRLAPAGRCGRAPR